MPNRSKPDLAIVRAGGAGDREAVLARLGLIPAWAKDPAIGSRMINARAETVSEKPAFRHAFRLRRCIVPVSGFYRWQRRGGQKQLYLIRRKDGAPMGFAGLWELWTDPATGGEVTSCAIITCEPNPLIAELHNRMPVILDQADYDAWLDPTRGGQELLRPCPEEWLEAVPVNSSHSDDATLLQREGQGLDPEQAALMDQGRGRPAPTGVQTRIGNVQHDRRMAVTKHLTPQLAVLRV